jgi:superoxide dismutase, Cu-Zn family
LVFFYSLGNVVADENGNVKSSINSTKLTLMPDSPLQIIGRAFAVHESADDCFTQPTGNSGARISQGVIGWKNNSVVPSLMENVKNQTSPKAAITILKATSNSSTPISGEIIFTQDTPTSLVTMSINITGMVPDSIHGFHIHQFGDVSDQIKGMATGGHFNPFNVSHGCFSVNETRHAGDFGNIQADKEGKFLKSLQDGNISLYPGVKNSILGHAITLHSAKDDCFTQPTGNAGSRIAQGVVGIRNSTIASSSSAAKLCPKM